MSNVLSVKREYQRQQWAQRIRECQASGLSNQAWCEQNGISVKTYYYHLRKLREEAVGTLNAAQGPNLVELDLPKQQSGSEGICLHYRDATLEIPSGTNSTDIAAVLEAVKDAC